MQESNCTRLCQCKLCYRNPTISRYIQIRNVQFPSAVRFHSCTVSVFARHSGPGDKMRLWLARVNCQPTFGTDRAATKHSLLCSSALLRYSGKLTTEHRRNRFANWSEAVMTPCGAHCNRICLSSPLCALWVETSTLPPYRTYELSSVRQRAFSNPISKLTTKFHAAALKNLSAIRSLCSSV